MQDAFPQKDQQTPNIYRTDNKQTKRSATPLENEPKRQRKGLVDIFF